MKKMKKLFAVILSLAMVLGMSLTTLANGSATITVKDGEGNNLTDATLSYLQIIKPDQTTKTGWAFASSTIEERYLEGYNEGESTQLDAQSVILELIGARGSDGYANTDKIGRALSTVAGLDSFVPMNNPHTVTSAGVYAVKAVQDNYTYNNMAAYVGFGTPEGGTYPTLTNAELTAKRSEIKLDKSHDDQDKVSAIGSIVTYTIKTNVPFIDPNKENKTYYIHDAIKGAEYYNLDTATVTLAGKTLNVSLEEVTTPTVEGYEKSFVINLCNLIDDRNSNAGEEIVVTYQAKVTAVTVDNKAQAGHKTGESYGGEFGEDEEDVYTGDITLYKKDEGNQPLANAGFEVTDSSNNVVYFTKDENGKYSHVAANDIPEEVKKALDQAADSKSVDLDDLEQVSDGITYVRQVFTKADGTVFVQGLNVGTYKFTEKTAPEGYSINENPVTGILRVTTADGVATEVLHQIESEEEMTIHDSKLSALPSTGGIGTTIFTIGGCAIMVIAAGLFFASRRKSTDAK